MTIIFGCIKKFLSKMRVTIWLFVGPKLGFLIDPFLWRYRHLLLPLNWKKNYISKDLFAHNHREYLQNIMSSLSHCSTILEIGCGSGANLNIAGQLFQHAELTGVDINSAALKIAEKNLSTLNSRSNLILSNVEEFMKNCDSKFDLIIIDAVLMYFHPDTLKRIMPDLKKICGHYLIICEQETRPPFYNGKWLHDYEYHLSSNQMPIMLKHKIDGWGGDWDKYGNIYLIDITDNI